MSKTNEGNPFDAFDILKGNFVKPSEESDDDVIAGDETIINEEITEISDEEKEKLKKGDDALEKVIKQQSKANSTNTQLEEEETEDEESEESSQSEITTNGYLDAIKDLREKGVLDFDSEDIEDSEEGFEKSINETVNKKIKAHVASLGEEALSFLGFIEQGGNPRDFINTYYGNHSWKDFDLTSEANQKTVIREALKSEGLESDEIEDMITEFEDNGTLEKRSKPYHNKLIKNEDFQKEALIKAQAEKDKQEKEANRKYWESFKSDLDKREEIKGFKVTPKEKDKLWSYMTNIDKNTGKTAYQKAVEENQDASLLFAYLAMNNFDTSKLETQVASKAASKLASLVKNYDNSSKGKISSGRTQVNKDGEDPFALFGKIK